MLQRTPCLVRNLVRLVQHDNLVAEVEKCPTWGLMVDETTDISVTKQLELVVRLVYFPELL